MAFRYSQGYAQDGQTTDPLPVQFPIANNYPDHFFDANWRHTFSPSIVNLFTTNYGRIRFNNGVSTDPSGIFGLTGNQLVGIPQATRSRPLASDSQNMKRHRGRRLSGWLRHQPIAGNLH